MYTSGQFCIMGRITRKALRVYEEKGLLGPNQIDETNGYKYYGTEEVKKLLDIVELKSLGMSLEQIKSILEGSIALNDCLQQRLVEVNKEIGQREEQRKSIHTKLSSQSRSEATYQMVEERYGVQRAISKVLDEPMERIGEVLSNLYQQLMQDHLVQAGPHFVYYTIDEEKGIEGRVAIPILEETQKEECFILPTGTYIKTDHTQGFSTVGLAHQAIIDWARENGVKLTGKAIERYVSIRLVEVLYEIEV